MIKYLTGLISIGFIIFFANCEVNTKPKRLYLHDTISEEVTFFSNNRGKNTAWPSGSYFFIIDTKRSGHGLGLSRYMKENKIEFPVFIEKKRNSDTLRLISERDTAIFYLDYKIY